MQEHFKRVLYGVIGTLSLLLVLENRFSIISEGALGRFQTDSEGGVGKIWETGVIKNDIESIPNRDFQSAIREEKFGSGQVLKIDSSYIRRLEAGAELAGFSLKCEIVKTAWQREKVCCGEGQKGSKFCLPSIVVVGAQKGGTTALHAHLLHHPYLEPPLKKELHMFDFGFTWKKMMNVMKRAFPMYRNDEKITNRTTFESTPSYTASPHSCRRMAEILPPSTIFAFILRDPVKRAWSEVQMKERRVISQGKFIELLGECAESVHHCVKRAHDAISKDSRRRKSGMMFPYDVQPCIVKSSCPNLASNARFPSLAKRLARPTTRSAFLNCFAKTDGKTFLLPNCLEKNILKEKSVPVPDTFETESEAKGMNRCLKSIPLRAMLEALKKKEISNLFKMPPAINECWMQFYEDNCLFCTASNDVLDCTKTCVSKISFDHKKCGNTLPGDKSIQEKAARLGLPDLQLSCRGPWCSCLTGQRMPSDISKGFLWRGLYFTQLANCIQFIDPRRIVLLENDELRHFPSNAIRRITDAAGIPPYDYSNTQSEKLMQEFDEKYPKFEDATGWRPGEVSTKIDNASFSVLQEFYKKPNEYLFKLIGKEYDWA